MNEEHLSLIKQGTAVWNAWRKEHTDVQPDLSNIEAVRADFHGIDFSNTILTGCRLSGANLVGSNLSGAQLQDADLFRANLQGCDTRKALFSMSRVFNANFIGANAEGAEFDGALLWFSDFTDARCRGANFRDAGLRATWFQRTDLTEANMEGASFIKTHLDDAIMDRCRIYGSSVWDIQGVPKSQTGLVITLDSEPAVTVDELKIGQFLHVLLTNGEVRNLIGTVARKGVLILGRFAPERKAVLDDIRLELRKHDYVPIMFDFGKPDGRTYIETVTTLAQLSKFIIADVTDAKVVLQELQGVMPVLPSVPVKVIAQLGADLNIVLGDFAVRCNLVEGVFRYKDKEDAIKRLFEDVVKPAEQWIVSAQAKAAAWNK